MTEFVFKRLPYDLGSQAGVALVGKALRQININAGVDPAFPVRSGHPNSAIFKAYLALLVQGKNGLAERVNEAVLGMKVNGRPIDFGAMSNGYTALDIDTFCMDNIHSAKEWVGRARRTQIHRIQVRDRPTEERFTRRVAGAQILDVS